MRRSWFSAFALVLTVAVGLAGCVGGGTKGDLTTVRFTEVIHSVFYAPQYIAQAKGYFEDEGIKLDFSTAQGSDRGMAAVLAGTADIALIGPEAAVYVYGQDTTNPVRIFAQLTESDGSFLLAREPEPNFSWADLRGKTTVGWRVGSMPQLVAYDLMRQAGIDPVRDTDYLTNIASPAMVGAFQSGQGEYLQVFEPLASQLEQAGQAYVVASLGDDYGALPYTVYVASNRFLQTHPDVVTKYTKAIYRAMKYLHEQDTAIIAQEIAPYFEGTDVGLLESSIRRYLGANGWRESPVMIPADYDRLQDLMISGGVLEPSKRAPWDRIATNEFAEAAVKSVDEE